jgi:threonine/homoserine/homoserine lactone efflux protein
MSTLLGIVGPALGVALNPFPVIAVILVLASPNATRKGLALLAGWSLGILAVVGVLVVVANIGGMGPDESSTPTWVSVLKLAAGGALLVLALRKWSSRPRAGEEGKLPGWLASLPEKSPGQLTRFGALLAGLNPKNLMFNVVASASIAASGASVAGEIGWWVLYILLASVTLVLPVVATLLAPASTADILASVHRWLVRHNATVLAVILLVIGLVLASDGWSGIRS